MALEGAGFMFAAVLKLHFLRLLMRKELWIAFSAMLLFVTVSFIETCVNFYGFDLGALPSAALAWIGNFELLRVKVFGIAIYFFIFLIAGAAYSDSHVVACRTGVVDHVVLRCGRRIYVSTLTIVTFISGVLVLLVPLAISQALALIVFPVEGAPFGFSTWFGSSVTDISSAWHQASSALFSSLRLAHPYLYNLLFIVYLSLWGGIMSLSSLAISFVVGKRRLLVLGLPTLCYLMSMFVLPQPLRLAHYLYPCVIVSGLSPILFAVAPCVVFAVCLAVIIWQARTSDLAD